jgi:hypothetical protein
LIQILQGNKDIDKDNLKNVKMIGYRILESFDSEDDEEIQKCNVAVIVKKI